MQSDEMEDDQIFGDLSEKLKAVKSDIEITPEVQAEYIAYHDKIDVDKYAEDDVVKESEKLFQENILNDEKKQILFALAHIGTLPCVRIIEEYMEKSSGELKMWSILAFEEAWMFLENEAMGTNQTKIFSGAGGDGERLRYYFSTFSFDKKPFSDDQKEKLNNDFAETGKKFDSEIENIEFNDCFFLVSVLVPMDVAVGNFIESTIKVCNETGKLLNSKYFVTNVRKPLWEEVKEYLNK